MPRYRRSRLRCLDSRFPTPISGSCAAVWCWPEAPSTRAPASPIFGGRRFLELVGLQQDSLLHTFIVARRATHRIWQSLLVERYLNQAGRAGGIFLQKPILALVPENQVVVIVAIEKIVSWIRIHGGYARENGAAPTARATGRQTAWRRIRHRILTNGAIIVPKRMLPRASRRL